MKHYGRHKQNCAELFQNADFFSVYFINKGTLDCGAKMATIVFFLNTRNRIKNNNYYTVMEE